MCYSDNLPVGSKNDPNAPWNDNSGDQECIVCKTSCDGKYCSQECYDYDHADDYHDQEKLED